MYKENVIYKFLFSRGGGVTGEKTQALEHKVYKLQEELTGLHRRKGEVGYKEQFFLLCCSGT